VAQDGKPQPGQPLASAPKKLIITGAAPDANSDRMKSGLACFDALLRQPVPAPPNNVQPDDVPMPEGSGYAEFTIECQ
jgi:hypothetical protein